MELINRFISSLQDLFSFLTGGSVCVGCGMQSLAIPLCKQCQNALINYVPFNLGMRCSKCGKELVSEIDVCRECKENQYERSLDGIFPLHMYRLWKKDLMFAWKSQGMRTVSPFFSYVLHIAIQRLLQNNQISFDYIIPVPPRPGKIRKKGWDQVDELCRYLHKNYGYQIIYPLERISSREQKTLNKEQRKGSLGAIYRLKPKFTLTGKKFLLIDDVSTTGATLDKCSRILKNNGAEEVYGLTLFMVD